MPEVLRAVKRHSSEGLIPNREKKSSLCHLILCPPTVIGIHHGLVLFEENMRLLYQRIGMFHYFHRPQRARQAQNGKGFNEMEHDDAGEKNKMMVAGWPRF